MQRLNPAGFSLLEVLVSIVVLATGVLGVLALMLTTMRAAQNADAESVAFHLGAELAEQLRGVAGDADLLRLVAQFDYDASAPSASAGDTAGNCYGPGASCSAAQVVQSKMDEWKARIKSRLPAGRVRICRDSSPWQESVKALRWECDAATAPGAPLWIKLGWQERVPASHVSDRSSSPAAPQLALHAN